MGKLSKCRCRECSSVRFLIGTSIVFLLVMGYWAWFRVNRGGTQIKQVNASNHVAKIGNMQLTNLLISADNISNKPDRTSDDRDADQMRMFLDSNNEEEALRLARKLMDSTDVDVRSKVVTTLGWIGVRALPELTQLLADGDETISSDAMTHWKSAFKEITDRSTKAGLLVMAITTMKKSTDIESLMMSFSDLPEDVTVRSLVQIINGDNPVAAEAAREHYSFITQTDYTTSVTAEAWIRARLNETADNDAGTVREK